MQRTRETGRGNRFGSTTGGRARLWSAAGATREQPWSLARALIEAFQIEEVVDEIFGDLRIKS